MVSAKSMEVRDNFKDWCVLVNEGEIVRISRPKNQDVILISANEYSKLEQMKRMAAYGSYFYGKDKVANLKRIKEIECLGDNWNSNGAKAFKNNLIQKVRKLTMSFDIQPEIFPTANNSVQLEWNKGDGEYLEMEVREDQIIVYIVDENGSEKNFEIDEKECKKVIEEFYK